MGATARTNFIPKLLFDETPVFTKRVSPAATPPKRYNLRMSDQSSQLRTSKDDNLSNFNRASYQEKISLLQKLSIEKSTNVDNLKIEDTGSYV